MLNIFKLSEMISESATGYGSIAAIAPYNFIGSMDEATAEFNQELMSETVDMAEFQASANEIIAEAAMTNPDRLDVIQESVFTSIKEGVIKFFNKIISMVKGLIEKLKAFFFKLTGKTDKWLKIMKPKIEDAKRRSGSSDATAEMHKWDIDYVTSGMEAALKGIITGWKEDSAIEGIKDLEASIKAYKGTSAIGAKGADADSEASKTQIEKLDKDLEKFKKELEDDKNKFPGFVAGKMGVSSNSTMDAVWKDVSVKATGGEKVTVKYVSEVGIDKMLNAIEGSKKTIDNLKKHYEDHLKKLTDARKNIETKFASIEFKDEDKYPVEIIRSARACAQQLVSNVTTNYSMLEAACNNARGANVKYVQDMTSEYMTVLSKFASIKSEKK